MSCPTKSWPIALAAVLAAASSPLSAQTPWPTPEVVEPGDTVIAEETALFVFTRAQMERLRTRQRNDSIRLARCRQDRESLRTEADTLRFALRETRRIVAADSAVIERLNDSGGLLNAIGRHLTTFGAGTLVGTAGDCIVN